MEISIIILCLYSAVMSTVNFIKLKKGGKITSDGVIGPKGEQIVKKKKR